MSYFLNYDILALMAKKIILFFILVAILASFIVLSKKEESVQNFEEQAKSAEGVAEKGSVPFLPSQTLPLSNDPKDVAWSVFEKYLEYNKTRDLDGIRSTVYKLAPICEDPKTRIECESRMASAYSYGKGLEKENFTNVWSDERQMILASDFWIEDSDDMDIIGRFRSIIFFVKDSSGSWKVLSWSPTKGGATSKGTASDSELNERITIWSEDKDEDGIADYSEECLDKPNDENCTKTDPKQKDSDGDGWWDGVEAYF